MNWASRRRFVITAIGAALIIFVLALILVPTLYQAPSCTDRTQNQGEQGVDCGGPCSLLCTALQQAPVVRFTKALFPAPNRVDVIAYVDNPNTGAAARRTPYTLTLYAADRTILKQATGTLDLPPFRSVPVYVPAFFTGNVAGAQAFLTIDPSKVTWFTFKGTLTLPKVASPAVGGTEGAPRVTATLSNPTFVPMTDIIAVGVVYDASDNVIAASQTLLKTIPPQGSVTATFTWGQPFGLPPARIEVMPLLVLPS
ncbi:hypothetical protein A3C95_01175 [Candidatus Kaiserbacteria bacterium RIFCSPHIGHO2_02_FULL_56_30]|uniref:Uncharacterized protein n=1 Tax=Candidatus Kaiserbacteria bacterium RIFCSPHIGHO2_02_FULL_56_30 TaxID=1798499 RepID=A0A1F6E256_9BACT|nr:MAG: hypothetical protein A3C95_01175 [Candidatus Kaiserbacteria bacterium RIFCSPHIGHO2_02_FULL_56_30]